jgi:hypothetical protein
MKQAGLCVGLFAAAGMLISGAAQAQSTFRLNAGVAPTTYKVSFDSNSPYPDQTAKSQYTAINFGVTWVSARRIYVDYSRQQSMSAKHDLWKDSSVPEEQDFSHTSDTLTVGYVHVFEKGANVSVFGGYTQGKTTLNAPLGATVPGGGTIDFSKDTFDSKGIFVGVGGGMPALGGQITGSVAVAGMSGKWKDDNGFDNSADTTFGFSIGAAYTYKFTPAWGVTADLKAQSYKYNFGTYTSTVTEPAYTVTERIVSTGVRLSYQF